MRQCIPACIAALAASAPFTTAHAQFPTADTTVRVVIGAFVDSYFAYDFGRPPELDRAYTTQPARHNEFNVNLAHVEAVLSGNRLRGRIALQAGTSVHANYAGEPTLGAVSGPQLSRFIQEAYAGFQVMRSLWVDGGVFFSHMGMESWVSSQNITYSRSLVADYSPYYSSGLRATWMPSPTLSLRLDVVNGWQIISESNGDKAVGLRVDYAVTPRTSVSYYNYVGNETEGRLRTFNGIGATVSATDRLRLLAQADFGTQESDDTGADRSSWYGGVMAVRFQLRSRAALAARVERFVDDDQVLIVVGNGLQGFRASGASLGLDVVPHPKLMWRTEIRGLSGDSPIFPDRDAAAGRSDRNAFIVTAMTVSF